MIEFYRINKMDRTLTVEQAVKDDSAGFAMKRFGSGVKGETAVTETVRISFDKLSGYELYEEGRMIDRGGTGIAKIVADYPGRKRDNRRNGWHISLGNLLRSGLLGSGICHSLKLRILMTNGKPVTVDFLPKPVSRKSPAYFKASRAARDLASTILSIIDETAERQREAEAERLLNYVKGRENNTAEIVSKAYEKYRRGEITEDEFQRIKYQTMLDPSGHSKE